MSSCRFRLIYPKKNSMEKKRKQIIITAILILVLIFAWAKTIKILKRTGNASLPSAAPSQDSPAAKAQGEVITKEKAGAVREDDSAWGRCPFSGKVYSSKGASDLTLAGIIWDEKTPMAMINKEIVKTGDKIEGKTVMQIRHDRVILNDGNKDFELRLER